MSERLFALTTNGGTELVARVVQTAAEELEWHPSTDALRLMIVAGNESADQDQQVSFRDACKQAISGGVMVNSIYCTYNGDGPDVELTWREIAQLADGHFAAIDQNNGTVSIETPFDEELIELSGAVNATYIPFGEHGQAGCDAQWAQDANAVSLNSATAASRANTKAQAVYNNARWDLVDACKTEDFKLAQVEEEDLPESMRDMTPEEREAYVKKMDAQRVEIQEKINELNAKRQTFITEEMKRQAIDSSRSFDVAVIRAIRSQAGKKGFEFETDLPGKGEGSDQATRHFSMEHGVWVDRDLVDSFREQAAKSDAYEFGYTNVIVYQSKDFQNLLQKLDAEYAREVEALFASSPFGVRMLIKHDGNEVMILDFRC